ncbi:XrtA system polysaccharide chain length determinant [Aestuariibacter sp. A3R04]|uniref:XrtA system polysaccharide chain length determinant n=1 Tax=Aestuariibacter sp. A3R04 TaxID=2841571 RepID=UPI001C081DD6|nr:XrtA system polysaccharide chain length determinant [Aestuariibacter sp. A3R04]MBU3021741.1 chain-length determining protein [Aestuariibacter sp. A3R04]
MQDLQRTLGQLSDYLKGIWVKKRLIMVCTWILCPIGFAYVALLPDVYRSQAVVYVDTRSVLQPLLKGLAIQSDPDQEIQMMAKTLLSRSNVETIARESDLDLMTTNDQEFDTLVDGLSRQIQLRSTGRDNIFTISYENKNPAMAQTVVQETLNLFVEGALGNNRRDTDTANRFLDEQIAEYESRLSEAEQRLADFKRQYSNILPLQGTFYSTLQTLSNDLEATRLQIKQTEQQVDSLNNQLSRTKSAGDSFGVTNEMESVLRTRYDERIKSLEEQLDSLQLRFTEQHPDVIETKALLANLEKARQKEIDDFLNAGDDDGDDVPMSDLNQEIKLEISRHQSLIAALQVKEQDLQRRITTLESKIDLVPQIEAESASLNRDYDITKQKYEDLLARRESADLSRRADVSAEELQFRIIEPPLEPNQPSGPYRILFYTLVLLMSFGIGTGLAFLFSQLSPLLIRASQLQQTTDYPVWGTVTHLHIDKINKSNRMRMAVFLLSSGTLVMVYGVLVGAELLDIDLLRSVL